MSDDLRRHPRGILLYSAARFQLPFIPLLVVGFLLRP